jgi:hypothetical protein
MLVGNTIPFVVVKKIKMVMEERQEMFKGKR